MFAFGARKAVKYSSIASLSSLGGHVVALDVDDTVSCFCRKARRKDKEASTPCPDDPKLYLEEAVLERKLPDVDLRVLVDLPAGLDYNEWLASHTIAFFDHINLVYGTISEFCTMSGCPDMTGPGLRTYLWFDDKGKKTRVAAPQYIDYVMTFTQKTISDESIFPTKYANEFPSSFESIVRKILRLLFHVLAHLYHCHFREVVLLNLHAHLNCVFAHLTLFNHRFQLIEPKETDILHDLEVALRVHADCHRPAAGAGAAPSDDATGTDEAAAAAAAGADEETGAGAGADANEDGDAATPPAPASGPGSATQGDAGAGARDALLSDLTLAPAPAPAPPPAPAPDAQQVA